MTRLRTISCLVCVFSAIALSAAYAQTGRKARILDASGVRSDISKVGFSSEDYKKFGYSPTNLIIATETFQYAIDLDGVKTITFTGTNSKPGVEVTYMWLGQERKLSGVLGYGEFTGESDFGQLKISAVNLRELIFADPPVALPENRKATIAENMKKYKALLTSKDGVETPVSYLERHIAYYSTEGYIIGGETIHAGRTNFAFQRGDSVITLEYDKLSSIEFGANETVKATLVNGNSADGTLSRGKDGVLGFRGFSDKGYFYIDVRSVKRIDFDKAAVK